MQGWKAQVYIYMCVICMYIYIYILCICTLYIYIHIIQHFNQPPEHVTVEHRFASPPVCSNKFPPRLRGRAPGGAANLAVCGAGGTGTGSVAVSVSYLPVQPLGDIHMMRFSDMLR